jgi:hypothetical protein
MLIADLFSLHARRGFDRSTLELGFQIAVLVLVSNARLVLRLPISGHSLLFAYFVLRRLFIHIPEHGLAQVECMIAAFLFAITSYVKVVQWSDPLTVITGIVLAVVLMAVSLLVLGGGDTGKLRR